MKKGSMHFHHWLIFGIVNGIVIYISSIFMPSQVVIGNANVSLLASVVLTALVLTAVSSLFPVFQKWLGMNKIDDNLKYIIYALINIIILWLLSRTATIFGFGIASKFTAITLGLILTIVNYLYWEIFTKKIKI
ncbi:hypothetical protein A3D78_02010 [Candidatus Gottesmanbacteria bacterium RIFCSPHIGHO2_02_FULL_39_14]|uniref:Uncharacterized protein n=3 Tax=Candidatus Gottesmaniibacteriota TaxID=1752720 RepID=A0A1F6A289_9BACT|nr:MAG: hypothetical protein A2153_04860 [Candidatus Gottesmanbacteria bacterium RBG_16_38_7b]OGG18769.1 MAG: hypothetical protein A3D78_02010 [Candidatus Gottesmanbacteria bacterium RIFCSPHIGHO2_02_FULL_39_14]OGG30947.1 MAG: hypothetical protein A3I51_02665 [Candidatus Gottesmanbacteria bacterium RIFCSPLOWO2_02_FULL_38_8]